jgi:hypothetical protein
VPVEKRRAGKPPERPKSPDTSLAVYEFKGETLENVHAMTIDQLTNHKLEIKQSVWLAVPSMTSGKCQ